MMNHHKLYYLIQAIRLVALDSPEQIASLPDFVVVPDEVALTLNDTLRAFEGSDEVASLAPRVLKRIRGLDRYFDDLGKEEHSLDALRNSPRWAHSRILAREILEILRVENSKPDLDWITFVPGSPWDDEPRT